MAGVDKEVCDAKHEAIHGEFKGVRATQALHRTSLENLENGQQEIMKTQKWLKPILVLLTVIFLTLASTLTERIVKWVLERNGRQNSAASREATTGMSFEGRHNDKEREEQ